MLSDVEDVNFLPGGGNSHKKALYEPDGAEKCRQIICSKKKAILIFSGIFLLIFVLSLIASFARPGSIPCSEDDPEVKTTPAADKLNIATDGSRFPWTDIRLPQTIFPVAYTFHMHPNLTTFNFNGQVEIIFQVKEKMDFVVFHSKNLSLKSFELFETETISTVAISRHLEYLVHEQIYLHLDSSLTPMVNYTLKVLFEGDLLSQMTGFYKSKFLTSSGEEKWIATTHFEPTDARAAFPCFDEPAFKASFKMFMVREKSHFSLFNTPLVNTVENNGLHVDEFEGSVKMSTYLVAFIVCDGYAKLTNTTKAGVEVSVYAPAELIDQASFALYTAVDILDYYANFFQQPYPLRKQDLIAIPDFAAGAMENWGLITYRMTALLYDPAQSSQSNQQWVAVVVAHELAHQWFGNLVTMQWWNDLWLNEGFASFVEYLGTDHVQPSWTMLDLFVAETLVSALSSDSLHSSHPISVPVQDPAEINEIFDHISYDKGASIIRMLQGFVGMDALQQGLALYLNKYKYGNAKTDDLWAALSQKTENIDVKAVMDTWTMQMGYPVIKVNRKGSKVHVTQERFLLNPRGTQHEEFESPFGYQWQVPLDYITSSTHSPEGVLWLKQDAMTFTLPDNPEWMKMNVNMTGYYRVCYDVADWEALIQQMQSDHTVFHAADRASLLDDAFALASSDYIDITIPLRMTQYLVNETDYVPWHVAMTNMESISARLIEKPTYQYYVNYVMHLIRERIAEVGWSDTGSHLDRYLRTLILSKAVKLNHKPSVDQALEMYRNWMNNNATISPNLKGPVYLAGIQYGGEEEWNHAWNMYKDSSVPSEKRKLLYALSRSTDSLRLNRYLAMSLDETKIRKGDTVGVVSGVASNPAGKVLAWRFVRQHWPTFKKRYSSGSFDMSVLIVRTASHFTNSYDYEEVKSFYEVHDVGSGKRAVAQALESIEMNIDWLTRNEKSCVDWFQSHDPSASDVKKRHAEEL